MLENGLRDWKLLDTDYDYANDSPIFDRLSKKPSHAVPEDVDVINMIVLWKLNRIVSIDPGTIELLNTVAQKISSPQVALSDTDVQQCVNELLSSKGIRLAMASTILHFYQPEAFPIVDERAYRQAVGDQLRANAGWKEYSVYIQACISLSDRYEIPFNRIDKILYQKDIAEGNKLHYS